MIHHHIPYWNAYFGVDPFFRHTDTPKITQIYPLVTLRWWNPFCWWSNTYFEPAKRNIPCMRDPAPVGRWYLSHSKPIENWQCFIVAFIKKLPLVQPFTIFTITLSFHVDEWRGQGTSCFSGWGCPCRTLPVTISSQEGHGNHGNQTSVAIAGCWMVDTENDEIGGPGPGS